MKHKILVCALAALSLLSTGSAFSQPGRDRDNYGRNHDNNGPMRGHGNWDRDGHDRRIDHQREEQRGAGPDQRYYRGDRLPQQYRTRHYVVNDWRGHRLSAPPRGYHWVQSGGDYMLVAIATGVILQLMLSH